MLSGTGRLGLRTGHDVDIISEERRVGRVWVPLTMMSLSDNCSVYSFSSFQGREVIYRPAKGMLQLEMPIYCRRVLSLPLGAGCRRGSSWRRGRSSSRFLKREASGAIVRNVDVNPELEISLPCSSVLGLQVPKDQKSIRPQTKDAVGIRGGPRELVKIPNLTSFKSGKPWSRLPLAQNVD